MVTPAHCVAAKPPTLVDCRGRKADFESDLLIGIFDKKTQSQRDCPEQGRITAPDARPYFDT
jgi:hypothetical protein